MDAPCVSGHASAHDLLVETLRLSQLQCTTDRRFGVRACPQDAMPLQVNDVPAVAFQLEGHIGAV